MSQLKLLKKVAVSTVCALPKTFFKEVTKETPIMRVAGIVRGHELVPTPYGEAVKFKGEFRAIDLTRDAPENCAGAACYLPAPVDQMLLSALIENPGAALEFAYDIAVVPDEKSNVGYQYRVRTLTESKPSDPMAALLEKASATPLPALTMAAQVGDGNPAPVADGGASASLPYEASATGGKGGKGGKSK